MEPSVTTSRRNRNMLTARLIIVLFGVLFAATAVAERWYVLWTGTFDAGGGVELDSITPAPGYSTAMALWVYMHHGINTFDCSPPVNCLATSQLTYYYVDCGTMQAAVIRRIPMNLRGKVVATIDEPALAWFPLVLRYLRYRRDDEDFDSGNALERERTRALHHREIRLFCGIYSAGAINQALNPPLR